MNRRKFLTGLVASPVVITTPGLLMPVRALELPLGLNGWFDYPEVLPMTATEILKRHEEMRNRIRRAFYVDSDLLGRRLS